MKYLRKEREKWGFTQRRLAEISGVPAPTISIIETGRFQPSDNQLMRIAEALGVSARLAPKLLDDVEVRGGAGDHS